MVIAVGLFFAEAISSISGSDRFGRVPMPGEKAIEFDAGDYSIYFEDRVETGENETFEAPPGIELRVRGLAGAADPEVDLGGVGSQVGTNDYTARTIGSLRVREDGRYGVVAGPASGVKPSITFGESSWAWVTRGAVKAAIAGGLTALLWLALAAYARIRPRAIQAPGSPVSARTPTVSAPPPPAPPVAVDAPRGYDRLDELERLAALRKSRAISEEEFQRLKNTLLARD